MNAGPRIAIDAMGGDTGPAAIIAGVVRARRKDSALQFTLFGDEKIVRAELKKHGQLDSGVIVCHTPESIAAATIMAARSFRLKPNGQRRRGAEGDERRPADRD